MSSPPEETTAALLDEPSTDADATSSDDFPRFLPLEFYVAGTPISLQCKTPASRDRWKAQVQDAARRRILESAEYTWLEAIPLELTIYYFPTAPMDGDVDNIVKPIADAMIGVAYQNDRQIERINVQKFEPDTHWQISDPSEKLAEALGLSQTSQPVVFVRLNDDLRWRNL